jgi:hypothetical protein
MGNNTSPDILRGFLLPHDIDQTNIDNANSSFSQSGNRAGDPVPQQISKLIVRAVGEQTAGSDLQIRTQRAGHAGKGGQFVWVDNAASSSDFGRLLPSNITNYDIADYSPNTSYYYKYPSMLGLDNGTLLIAVFSDEPTFLTPRITLYSRTEDDDIYSTVTIANLVDPILGISLPETYPALCKLPDGSILCIFNTVYGTAGSPTARINFKAYRSTDNGDTWNLYSNRLIDTQISAGTGSGQYEVKGVQIAALNGQVLLLLETRFGTSGAGIYQNRLFQFASVDSGQTFIRVTSAYDFDSGYHRVRLTTRQSQYYVSYIAETSIIHSMQIPHAFFSISLARNAEIYSELSNLVTVESNLDNEDMAGGELAIVVDEDDIVYAYFRRCNLTGEEKYISRVSKDGTNWEYMASGTSYWYQITDSSGTIQRPTEIQGTAVAGRIAIGHNFDTSISIKDTLSVFWMGGYSSLTYPFIDDSKDRYKKITFNTTYIPYNEPSSISEFTASGTGADSISIGRLYVNTTSSTERYYTSTYSTTTLDQGLICRCRFEAGFGGSTTSDARYVSIEIGDGTDRYGIICRISAASVYLIDMHSGTSIADTNIGNGINDVILAISNNDGKLYLCTETQGHTKSYIEVGNSGGLTSGGTGLTGGSASFGHGTYAGTVRTYFYEFMVSSDGLTGLQMSSDTPELASMNYPPAGKYVYIADGVRITTLNGPAILNDEYNIKTRYEYGIDNVFYVNSPSLKSGWRSITVSAGTSIPTQEIIFNGITDALGSPFTGNGVIGIHLAGINFKRIQVYSKEGAGSFTLRADKNTSIEFYYDERAGTIIPNSSNAAIGPYIQFNEYAGATLQLTDGSTTVFTRIVSNTEGTLSNSSTKKPVFYIEKGVTIPTTGTNTDREAFIIPTSCTLIMYMDNNLSYDELQLRFASQATAENYMECSHISIGAVVFPGQQYGRGRTISIDSGTISEQLLNGTRFSKNVRDSQRTIRVSWADPIDITTMSSDAVDPNYWTALTSSTDAIATDKDVPLFMLGLLQRLKGTYRPLVYLPYIERLASTGSVQADILARKNEQVLAVITSDVTIESVLGNEEQDEIFRVSTITIEEVL